MGFLFSNKEIVEQKIVKYFQDSIGSKSSLISTTGFIRKIHNSTIPANKAVLDKYKIPYKICSPSRHFSLFHDLWGDSPEDNDYSDLFFLVAKRKETLLLDVGTVLKELDQIEKESGMRENSNDFTSRTKQEEYQGRWAVDDFSDFKLSDKEYCYICFSLDDLPIIQDIFLRNNLQHLLSTISYPDGENWAYLEFEWEAFPEDSTNNESNKVGFLYLLLSDNDIPYIAIKDKAGSFIIKNQIIEREYKSGYRLDLHCTLRSSWEANIARVFNLHSIPWEYEKKIFDLSDNISYIPDFFLPDNVIVEVKGFWDADSRKKVKEFQKDHPEFTLLFVDADMYPSIRNKYKNRISEWEEDGNRSFSQEDVPIVGMKYCASTETLNELNVGDRVLFRREPDNKYDKYAILAINEQGDAIGHMSSDWSFIYASKIDLGMEYEAKVKAIDKRAIHITVIRTNTDKEVMLDYFT